jgi:hypothetical protein
MAKPDLNQLAAAIVAAATGGNSASVTLNGKNPAAVMLGRLGGKKGGRARAEKLSKERRREIAQDAARRRWSKKRD